MQSKVLMNKDNLAWFLKSSNVVTICGCKLQPTSFTQAGAQRAIHEIRILTDFAGQYRWYFRYPSCKPFRALKRVPAFPVKDSHPVYIFHLSMSVLWMKYIYKIICFVDEIYYKQIMQFVKCKSLLKIYSFSPRW